MELPVWALSYYMTYINGIGMHIYDLGSGTWESHTFTTDGKNVLVCLWWENNVTHIDIPEWLQGYENEEQGPIADRVTPFGTMITKDEYWRMRSRMGCTARRLDDEECLRLANMVDEDGNMRKDLNFVLH